MKQLSYIFLCLLFGSLNPIEADAQVQEEFTWTKIEPTEVNGRLADKDIDGFNRLPLALKSEVREPVWRLSQHSAGLYLQFTTDAEKIRVEYQVKGNKSMPHMPATGVSGVDLYALDGPSEWCWIRGNYRFQDTISYNYSGISKRSSERVYYLYLPLYTKVEWLKIGVPKNNNLEIKRENKTKQKPLVVYGTSIAQGACASRPGMAWTNILSRNLARPIVNLGFSGNGLLEEPILDYFTKYDAEAIILDCMPNFTRDDMGPEQARKRLREAITLIRSKHKKTPILLVQHGGYSDGALQQDRKQLYTSLNKVVTDVYHEMIENGVQHIYMLTKEEIGLGVDAFVDGTHPNDHGMIQYARAYEKFLKERQLIE